MAWVTLSLRKMELIHQHNELELEDLKISREERQMARRYQLAQRQARNGNTQALADEKTSFKSTVDELKQNKDNITNIEYQQAYNEAKEDHDEKVNQLKTETEDTVAELEEEKVQIETQMEAVAAEMDAIKQQISTDIQNEAIQLH